MAEILAERKCPLELGTRSNRASIAAWKFSRNIKKPENRNFAVANCVTLRMRLLILFTTAAICSSTAIAQSNYDVLEDSQSRAGPGFDSQVPAAKSVPFPLQLEMRVPFEPTAFPSDRNLYVMYELHLTNFGTTPLYVSRIEVLDADAAAAQPIATFEKEQIETMLQPVGGNTVAAPNGNLTIAGGRSAIVFISVAFDRNSHLPDRLLHRVITTDSGVEGAAISTHYTTLHILGPPLAGANWVADDGPSNDQDNHYRRGIFVLDGRAVISRRYAIDWEQIKDGATFSGDSRDVRSYFAYG
jgi:hypothetical protein